MGLRPLFLKFIMTTIWKPRGPQKPKREAFDGVRINQLVEFCRSAQMYAQDKGDMDISVTFEILAEYLQNDYKIGQPLKFNAHAIGY